MADEGPAGSWVGYAVQGAILGPRNGKVVDMRSKEDGSKEETRGRGNVLRRVVLGLAVAMTWVAIWAVLWGAVGSTVCAGQENPLSEVHTQPPPPPPKTPEDAKPVIEGAENAATLATSRRDARDTCGCEPGAGAGDGDGSDEPAGDGAGEGEFEVYDNNMGQVIKSFSTEDAPVTIGIVFDLSGSMTSKFLRARKALSEFLRTSQSAG